MIPGKSLDTKSTFVCSCPWLAREPFITCYYTALCYIVLVNRHYIILCRVYIILCRVLIARDGVVMHSILLSAHSVRACIVCHVHVYIYTHSFTCVVSLLQMQQGSTRVHVILGVSVHMMYLHSTIQNQYAHMYLHVYACKRSGVVCARYACINLLKFTLVDPTRSKSITLISK